MTASIYAIMDATKLVPIAEAAGFFPVKIGTKAVIRRIRSGHRGVRLKAIRDGGKWFTCREWVEEFQQAVTEKHVPIVSSPAALQRRVAAARAILARRYGRRGTKAKSS